MKKIYCFLLFLLSIGVANSAFIPHGSITISGGTVPWQIGDITVDIIDNVITGTSSGSGNINSGDGSFAPLIQGTFVNSASTIDLSLVEGNYSGQGITMFNNFTSLSSPFGPGDIVNHALEFSLESISNVIITSNKILLDMVLLGIMPGYDDTLFGFRWELSTNGITGSYSASTPIPLNSLINTTIPEPRIVVLIVIGFFLMLRNKNKKTNEAILA